MELHFTTEQEAQLAQVAQHAEKPVEECLTDAAMAMLHKREVFLSIVEKGIAAADENEIVDDDDGKSPGYPKFRSKTSAPPPHAAPTPHR